MSARGLTPQKLAIPLAAGLNQKADPRSLQAPELTRFVDGEFDEIGGIQTRKPYEELPTEAFDADEVRVTYENGPELLCFTKDKLWSRSDADAEWIDKGTHLAVKLEEVQHFTTTGEQVDPDRAELNGYVIVSWHEVRSGNTYGYVAAYDKATGAVTMPARELAAHQRIRLIALDTRILLSFYDGATGFYVYALDPASPATALTGASTTIVASNGTYYDVVKVPGADLAFYACTRSGGGAYEMVTLSSSLTKLSASKSAACVAIAVSAAPNGTHVQVVRRSSSTTIHGDYIAISGFTTVNDDTAIATTTTDPTWIACAHRSVADGGFHRCYVFWNEGEGPDVPDTGDAAPYNATHQYGTHVFSNWVDTDATIGTAALFVALVDINSRAFDYNGHVCLWLGFSLSASIIERNEAGGVFNATTYAPQNSYFLYRDDGLLCAKSTMLAAGGAPSRAGWLPNVQALSATEFAWAGTKRRAIEFVGDDNRQRTDFAARSPIEISITFDSDEARRCVRLGNTVYIVGGEVVQYDGVQLTEVGFHVLPYVVECTDAGGSLATETYAWKVGPRWDNAGGDVDRGSTPSIVTYTVPSAKNALVYTYPLTVTHKTNRPIAIEMWRTPANPTADSAFHRVTSKNPGDIGLTSNKYINNDTTAAAAPFISDEYTDETLQLGEQYPINGGGLESMAPPAATIIAATADRLFIAGVAGDPDRVWYSKTRNDGEVASFNGRLTANVPRQGGAITALAFLNETLIAFRETCIYALPGDGFDNTGGGSNYGPARTLSFDVGAVNAESVALTPAGLIFKSNKGWYLLDRGWSVQYIGDKVSDYDAEAVKAVHVVESQHQIRCLTESRLLVFDYLAKQWGEWSLANGVSACVWNGRHLYASSTLGVLQQRTDFTGIDYGLDVELAWIPMGQIQGFGRVWMLYVLGEYRGAHKLRVRLGRNYATTYFQDKLWTVSPTTIGEPLQVKHEPKIQELQAIRIRLTAVGAASVTDAVVASTTEALKLTSLALEVGLEPGLMRLPAVQRQ